MKTRHFAWTLVSVGMGLGLLAAAFSPGTPWLLAALLLMPCMVKPNG